MIRKHSLIAKYSNSHRTVAVLLLILIAGLFSCEKDTTNPDPQNNTTNGSFNWSLNSQNTAADSAVCYLKTTTIYAYKNGLSQTVELNLSDIITNTYPVNSLSGNAITYADGNGTKEVANGSIQISANSGSKLSGSFSGTITGTTETITGSFSDVTIR